MVGHREEFLIRQTPLSRGVRHSGQFQFHLHCADAVVRKFVDGETEREDGGRLHVVDVSADQVRGVAVICRC